MTDRIETAKMQFDGLLARQQQEREDLAVRLLAEEREAADRLRAEFTPEVGLAMNAALTDAEKQLRAEVRTGGIRARIETNLPDWMMGRFPALDEDERADGRRPAIVFLPRPWADGHTDRLALLVVDATDVVYGRGARARRDQQVADEAAHAAEIRRARAAEDEERARRR